MPLNKKLPVHAKPSKASSDESSEEEVDPLDGLYGDDQLPAPYERPQRGSKIILAERTENPIVFMEIHSSGGASARGGGFTRQQNVGRLFFELRNDLCPVTVNNFLTLCTGKNGWGPDGICYHYKNTRLHRIVKGVLFEAGDLLDQKGNCSRSIYNKGGLFKDENYLLRHTGPGCLSMCNRGPDTNGSLFQVSFTCVPELDENYVVFGCLADEESYNTLSRLNVFGTDSGEPTEEVRVVECGLAYPLPKGQTFHSANNLHESGHSKDHSQIPPHLLVEDDDDANIEKAAP